MRMMTLRQAMRGIFDDEPIDWGGGGGDEPIGLQPVDQEDEARACLEAGGVWTGYACEAPAAPPTTGEQGTQFKPYTGEPADDRDDSTDLPPWVQAGIDRCQGEGRIYDAASDSCVDDPCEAEGKQFDEATGTCVEKVTPTPPRGGGGGGGGGGSAKRAAAEDKGGGSRGVRLATGGALGAVLGGAAGAGAASLARVSPIGGGLVGGLLGAVLGGVVAGMGGDEAET